MVPVRKPSPTPACVRALRYDGLNVDVLHAERSQTQRDATVAKFRQGKVWVLIATELVARGMDFKGVSLVINYDFPQSTTSYIHRIGRTGRAGRAGRAITFFTESDMASDRESGRWTAPALPHQVHQVPRHGC